MPARLLIEKIQQLPGGGGGVEPGRAS